MNGELAKPIVLLIEHVSKLQHRLIRAERRVALNIPRHSICDMRERLARVRAVSILVNHSGMIDISILGQRPHPFIPMDMASKIEVDAVLKEQILERISQVLLITGCLGRVHGSMAHGNDPGRLLSVDLGQIILQPVELFVGLVFGVVTFDVAEWPSICDVPKQK